MTKHGGKNTFRVRQQSCCWPQDFAARAQASYPAVTAAAAANDSPPRCRRYRRLLLAAVGVVVAASSSHRRCNRHHSADFQVVVACHPLTWPRGRWEVREIFAIGGGP